MDLRFAPPDLRKLDLVGTEVFAACVAEDERPPHGAAGLFDWRLAGQLSRLLESGFATGGLGEVVLLSPKPRLPFDKALFFGIGRIDDFDDDVCRTVVGSMLRTLEGLRARTAVVELPGRHIDAISPDRAADILLEMAGGKREHDIWTLIETPEAQKSITQHMIRERRRVRR